MPRARRWETPTYGATRRRTLCGGSTCARVQCVMNKIWRRRRKIVLGLFQRWKYRFASERKKICLFLLPSCVSSHSSSSSGPGCGKCQRTHTALTCHSQFLFGMSGNWILSGAVFKLAYFRITYRHTDTQQAAPSCRSLPWMESHPNVNLCSCSCNLHTSSAFLYKILRGKKKNGMT